MSILARDELACVEHELDDENLPDIEPYVGGGSGGEGKMVGGSGGGKTEEDIVGTDRRSAVAAPSDEDSDGYDVRGW